MEYSKAKVVDNKLVLYDTKMIEQSSLNSDCWLIQFDGIIACETCEFKNTKDCGGGNTLKKLQKVIK